MRLLVLLAALTLATPLLAGCTTPDEAPDAGPDANPAPNPGNNPPAARPPAAKPNPPPVQDAGDIAGPFQKTWDVEVPAVGFREAHVDFALAGAQPGAPPTARVQLSLLDPDGKVVRTALLGLGGEGDQVSWTLHAADMPMPGTYRLEAVNGANGEPGTVPSVGLAKYTLHAEVDY